MMDIKPKNENAPPGRASAGRSSMLSVGGRQVAQGHFFLYSTPGAAMQVRRWGLA
jgi:hypothetical protein